MPPPVALLNWFRSSYPTLVFDPEWLEGCTGYLMTHYPATTPQQLIKKVETQLLLSDLNTSVLPSPRLLPSPLPEHPTTLFPTRPDRVLVQVTAIDEVGHPALGLLETLKEKREMRRVAGLGRELKDGEEEVPPSVYPRGLVRLTLSDGHSECGAFEYRKIEGLGLEEVRLGCKLLLHQVKVVKNMLLLSPDSVVVKGNSVEEMEEMAELQLETRLRDRLGLGPPEPQEPPVVAPVQRQEDVEDDDEAEAAAAHNSPPPPPAPRRREAPAPAARQAPPPPAPRRDQSPIAAPKPKAPPKARAPPPPRARSPDFPIPLNGNRNRRQDEHLRPGGGVSLFQTGQGGNYLPNAGGPAPRAGPAPKALVVVAPKPKPARKPTPPPPTPVAPVNDPSSDLFAFPDDSFDADTLAVLDELERSPVLRKPRPLPPPPPEYDDDKLELGFSDDEMAVDVDFEEKLVRRDAEREKPWAAPSQAREKKPQKRPVEVIEIGSSSEAEEDVRPLPPSRAKPKAASGKKERVIELD